MGVDFCKEKSRDVYIFPAAQEITDQPEREATPKSPAPSPCEESGGQVPSDQMALPGCPSTLVLMLRHSWLWEVPRQTSRSLCLTFSGPRHVKGRGISQRNKSRVSALLKTTDLPRRAQSPATPPLPQPCLLPAQGSAPCSSGLHLCLDLPFEEMKIKIYLVSSTPCR